MNTQTRVAVLEFEDALGKEIKVRIPGVKTGLTADQIKSVMDLIVAKDFIRSATNEYRQLVKVVGAHIVTTDTEELEVLAD